MTTATILVAIDGVLALAALGGCLYAARRHPVKRLLWLVTAILMAYFVLLVIQVLAADFFSSWIFSQLFRPMMGALFALILSHSIVDGRRRG